LTWYGHVYEKVRMTGWKMRGLCSGWCKTWR